MHDVCGKVRLRALEPEDLALLEAWENDPSLQAVGTATGPYSRYQLRNYIASSQNDLYADGQLRLMIEHADLGTVGIIDLCTFDARHNRAEVGLLIAAPYRRKGFGRQAVRLLETHCFESLGLAQLYLYVAADNVPCLHLFLSEGYKKSGCLSHWLRTGTVYKDVCLLQKLNPALFASSIE